jgi:hypothetical protein
MPRRRSACNGTTNLDNSPRPGSIALTGGSLAASGANCTIDVPVTGTAAGQYTNVSGFISSTQSGVSTNYATDCADGHCPADAREVLPACVDRYGRNLDAELHHHEPESRHAAERHRVYRLRCRLA